MTRLARVEQLRGGALIVSSYSLRAGGFRVMNEWFAILDRKPSDRGLGTAVADALDRAEQDVSVLAPAQDPFEALLGALGIGSVGEYMRGAKAVSVRRNQATAVVPSQNRGRDGFHELPEAARVLHDPSDRLLGHAVREALVVAA